MNDDDCDRPKPHDRLPPDLAGPDAGPSQARNFYPSDRAAAGNEADLGGRPAYQFEAGGLAGVTLDPAGQNLPRPPDKTHWTLKHRFTLGVRDVALLKVSPEPVIRGILANGYFVWRTDAAIGGRGTSQ